MRPNPRIFSFISRVLKPLYSLYLSAGVTGFPAAGLSGWASVVIAFAFLTTGCGEPGSVPQTVRIDAAASIAYVIEGLAGEIEQDLGVRIEINAGASGALAKQIAQGDGADLFISADPAWVDELVKQNLIDTDTRVNLVANRLVLVGRAGSGLSPGSLADLQRAEYQPIALGDPAYVPAGRYAVQALSSHGLERGPGLKLAEAPDVRAALAFVVSGQCPVGLVYASDVKGARDVVVLLTIDPAGHDPIRYPAAVVRDAPNHKDAVRVLDWLKGERAQAAFRDAGFMDP
jgi:molybdate transport system substrate-binding protein